jgi:hypothetical protein
VPPYFLTISAYQPSSLHWALSPRVGIRLCSVDLWMGNLAAGVDFSLDILVGIGNITTIIQSSLVREDYVPVLDPGHGILPLTMIRYGIVQGSAGTLATYYGPSGQEVLLNNSQQVIGSLRAARPVRFRWRKEERPAMELYQPDGCPCIWGRQRIGPGGLPTTPTIEGMVVFESEQ